MERLAKVVNGFQALTIFEKRFILDGRILKPSLCYNYIYYSYFFSASNLQYLYIW